MYGVSRRDKDPVPIVELMESMGIELMTEVVTWFTQPRKYYFPGQNYHFPGQSIQDLKVLNKDVCEKQGWQV